MNRQRLAAFAFLACCFVGMCWLITNGAKRLIYDEPAHMGMVARVEIMGWHDALVSGENMSAAGPLYGFIHSMALPLTHGEIAATRSVQLVVFCMTMVGLWLCHRWTIGEADDRVWRLAAIVAIPFLWPAVGMVLTEVPASLPFSICLLGLAMVLPNHGVENQESLVSRRALTGAVIGGLGLGASILGRQTYLAVIPCLALLMLLFPGSVVPMMILLAVALASSCWLFVIWGGLTPPSQQFVDSGIRLDYGLLGLGYMAVAMLFVSPGWWLDSVRRLPRSALAAGAVVAVLLSIFVLAGEPPPGLSLLRRLLPESLIVPAGHVVRAGMIVVGLLVVEFILYDLWHHRRVPWRTCISLLVLTMALSPAKIGHNFSSRYLVGALPLLVVWPALTPPRRTWHLALLVPGAIAGASALLAYYRFKPA